MSDFSTVKISDWENHFIITPHQITVVKVELLESPQLPVLRNVWVARLAQKSLEIHDSNYPIIEGQTNLVIRNVSCFRNLQIVCRSRFHFSFLLMTILVLAAGHHVHFLSYPRGFRFFRSPVFVCSSLCDKLILKLPHKTLHRPGAGFAEGADRASARNIIS